MKKLILLLAMILSIVLVSCSDNKNEIADIILDKTTIDIPYQGEGFISVSGTNEYEIKIDDEYFITASHSDGGIKIWAYKVGKTKIIVSNANTSSECIVNVTPVVDYIGIPIIAFGENRDYILSKEDNEQVMNDANWISFLDRDILFGATHNYHFKDGKLSYILTFVGISNFNDGDSLPLFLDRVGHSLQERYSYLEAYNGIYQDIYIYTFQNEYYIGARLAGGNGGWYICYAESLEHLKEILDVHPSLDVS